MLNEEELWIDSPSPSNALLEMSPQQLTTSPHIPKLKTLLAKLKAWTQHYPIPNPVDFLVEILLKEAKIHHPLRVMNCQFESCGARGPEFCTLFTEIPETTVQQLMTWLNQSYPALSAKSLNALSDEEKNTNDFTVISLTDGGNITLHIETLQENILLMLRKHLILDPHNRLKFYFMKAIERMVGLLREEQTHYRTASLDPLIGLLRELVCHLSQYGINDEIYELKAQLQNINNAQHEALLCQLRSSHATGFFMSLKKSTLQKLSDTLTEVLLDLCQATHIKILVNSAPALKH